MHALVVSCEHAGNRVPDRYRPLFLADEAERALESHRGWDPGALPLARSLARRFDAPLVRSGVTRLLVETNRSLGHPALFSEFSVRLDDDERERVIERYWRPHRERVRSAVETVGEGGRRVLHLGVHTFTPVWKGRPRPTDVGILYDPRRPAERRLAEAWVGALRSAEPAWTVHRNRPYRGDSDGLTTSLRERFGPEAYLGVEVEVSQARVARPGPERRRVARALAESLSAAISPSRRPG